MSKRIGERLIAGGLIDQAQLDKALKAQLIMGGHLGTSLIELGFVEEDSLAEALAEMHRVKPVTTAMLTDIPPEVIDMIPSKTADGYRVIPLSVKAKTLNLAVIEPRSVPPISTVRGVRKIVPWIAPEIRILQALERYYGVPRRPRYLNICNELERDRSPRGQVESAEPAPGGVRCAVAGDPVTAAPPPAVLSSVEVGEEYGYGKPWREVAKELFDGDTDDVDAASEADAVEEKRVSRGVAPPAAGQLTEVDEAAEKMSHAETKDDLSRAVLGYVAKGSRNSILFAVRNEAAHIWDWRGFAFSPDRVNGLRFPVTSGSIFTLLLGNNHYHGPVPDERGCEWFFGALQVEIPREILLVPAYLDDRLVAILYADGGPREAISGKIDDFHRIARKLSLALNMLILKMKIRSA